MLGLSKVAMVAISLEQALSLKGHSVKWKKKINYFLMEPGGEWLVWKHNPPTAGNMEGVWEQ